MGSLSRMLARWSSQSLLGSRLSLFRLRPVESDQVIDVAVVKAKARENAYLMMLASLAAGRISRRFGIALDANDIIEIAGIVAGSYTIVAPYWQHATISVSAQQQAPAAANPTDDEITEMEQLLIRIKQRKRL